MNSARLQLILQSLNATEKPWFGGPSPAGSLRNVTSDAAILKPAGLKHCMWELALHIAYWEYAVRRVLEGGPKGGFPRSPSNWPILPEKPTEAAWRADRALVRHERDALIEAIRAFDASRLDDPTSTKTKRTYAELLLGIIQHSAYHTGQMALLKRMDV